MRARFPALAASVLLLLSCSSAKAPPIERDYTAARITDRVYVIHGPNEFPNRVNQGFSNNPGYVLVHGGVVVIDPGASVQVGELVLRKVAAVTHDPVIAVFNTHIDGDHWLGNQAIKAAFPGAVIYAHPKMLEAIRGGDGEKWIEIMNTATDGACRGTKVVAPDLGLDQGDALRLRGTTFRIYHNDRARTDNDIMIEVVEEGVIFLGDNVLNRRIAANFPGQGNIQGQIESIDLALGTGAGHFIPGHGMSGGREMALVYQTFLRSLRGSVKKYYDQGLSNLDMKDKVMRDLDPYKEYSGFDNLGHVIDAVYHQIDVGSS